MEINSIWQSIVHELEAGVCSHDYCSFRFHNSLAALFSETVRLVADQERLRSSRAQLGGFQ